MDAADSIERGLVSLPGSIEAYRGDTIEVVHIAPRRGDAGAGGYGSNGRIDKEDHEAIVIVGDGTADTSAE